MHVKLLERPSRNNYLVVKQIIGIVTELTEDWFIEDVPEWIENGTNRHTVTRDIGQR